MLEYEDLHYRNNFLTNVIFRLDFSPILEISKETPSDFQKKIRDMFPSLEQKERIKYTTEIKGNEKIDKTETHPHYKFKSDNMTVDLTQEFLSVEFFKYNNFKEFKEVVKQVLDSFHEIYHVTDYQRLGLRYINQIVFERGHPLKWKEYINNSLIQSVEKFFNRDERLARAMSHVVLNFDDYNIIFNYGLFNSEFPAKISRKEFVLDYDCYTNFVDYENIYDQLVTFNQEIKSLFENSIKSSLKSKMEVLK